MFRFLSTAALFFSFTHSAQAGAPYDLRALASQTKTQQAGEVYRTTSETEKVESGTPIQEGVALDEQTSKSKEREEFVTEVQAVDADGRPTRLMMTYQTFGPVGPSGPTNQVAGIKVQIEKSGDSYGYKQLEGPTMPAALRQELDSEMANLAEENDAEDVRFKLLLPPNPKAVGESWPIDVIAVIKDTGMPAVLNPEASKGSGVIQGLDTIKGRQFLTVDFDMNLGIKELNGMPCKTTCQMKMKMKIQVPVDGQHGDMMETNSMSLSGRLGSPTDPSDPTQVELSMQMKQTEKKERIK